MTLLKFNFDVSIWFVFNIYWVRYLSGMRAICLIPFRILDFAITWVIRTERQQDWNWNLGMLVLEKRGKLEFRGKKPPGARTRTNNKLNLGHIRRRRVLSPQSLHPLWSTFSHFSTVSDHATKYAPMKLVSVSQNVCSSAAPFSNHDRHRWVTFDGFQNCLDCIDTSFKDYQHHRDTIWLITWWSVVCSISTFYNLEQKRQRMEVLVTSNIVYLNNYECEKKEASLVNNQRKSP